MKSKKPILDFSGAGKHWPTILSVIVLFCTKIIGDIVLIEYDYTKSWGAYLWKIGMSYSIIYIIIRSVFRNINTKTNALLRQSPEDFNTDLSRTIIVATLFLLFMLPLSFNFSQSMMHMKGYLIYSELLSLFGIMTGTMLGWFVYKWLWVRRHKNTRKHHKIIKYTFLAFLIVEIPLHMEGISIIVLFNVIRSISTLVVAILLILVFVTNNKNTWIAMLPRAEKLKLLATSFTGLLVTIIISSGLDSILFSASASDFKIFAGADSMIILPVTIYIAYLLRIFLAGLLSLPTTKILERTTSEISSLAYLNRIAVSTIDREDFLSSVTKLAMFSCEGAIAWTELYDEKDKYRIIETEYITLQQILTLNVNRTLTKFFCDTDSALLIESINESPILNKLSWKIVPGANSMIIVPIITRNRRIGTLVVIHSEDYGMDREDLRVMEAFADNIRLSLDNLRLVADSIEKERYQRELVLAREMEQKLLPAKLPDIPGFSLSAFSLPAEEVGGDYYDIIKLKNGNYCIIIGDVSGKGMSAAFYMAQLKGVIMAIGSAAEGPADLLSRINSGLYGKIERQMYITMSALEIRSDSAVINMARAGHMPFLIARDDKVITYTPKGIGIGLANKKIFDSSISGEEAELLPGDICLAFTDGINEMRNSNDEELGLDNLKQILKNYVYIKDGAEGLIHGLRDDILSFADGSKQHDDMTIVVISRNRD